MDKGIRKLNGNSPRGDLSRRDFLRLSGALLGAVSAGSLISACASAGQPTVQSEATPAESGAPTSGQVIKIGAPFPLTGPWAENGINSVNGIQLAVEEINAQGGIKALNGAQLELVRGDVQNDPSLAASVTRRLIEVDKVTALIGCYLSSFTLTASTEAEKAQIPMITNSFLDELTARGYKFFFQPPAKASMMGTNALAYFRELLDASGQQLRKFANLSDDNANTQVQARTISEKAGEFGFEEEFLEFYTAGLSDATAIANKVRASDADFITLNGPTPDVILIVRTLRNLGWMKPIIGTGGGGLLNRGFGDALGSASDGVFGMAAWNWDLPYEGIASINDAFTSRFDEPFMPQEAGEAYVITWIIKEALESIGVADPIKLRDALASMTFDQPPASLMPGGIVKFDETGWNSHSFPVLIEWKDQKPHTVWPESVAAMEPFFG